MYYFLTFVLLYGIWLLLSGLFDPFHMTLGLISTLIVTLTSTKTLFGDQSRPLGNYLALAGRALGYTGWLLWQVVLSNLQVFALAMDPRLKEDVDPHVLTFRTRLKSDLARYVLANSITLTPGTVTIKLDGDEFHVHAISRKISDGMPGEMEDRIAALFGEVIQ